jgi:hypothetical protein
MAIEHIKTTFSFEVNKATYNVVWLNTGKGTIAGRVYPTVYHVYVNNDTKVIASFRTSFNCNKTNSIQFINQSKQNPTP